MNTDEKAALGIGLLGVAVLANKAKSPLVAFLSLFGALVCITSAHEDIQNGHPSPIVKKTNP